MLIFYGRNVDDESWVLIENQLERTDHIHLGQLLTYAAGLHAVTIVWIAAQFTDEHRAAIDWLNEITADSYKFFALEVELWKIGDSLAAPKFNIISKPNDWSRSVRDAARDIEAGELTETKQTYLEYWQAFRDKISANEMLGRAVGKVNASQYLKFRLGRSGFHISATVSEWEDRIGVQFVIEGAHAAEYYQLLLDDRVEIEEELGFALDWDELPDRKRSKVSLSKFGVGIMERDNWTECQDWMETHLTRMVEVLGPRVQRLELDD